MRSWRLALERRGAFSKETWFSPPRGGALFKETWFSPPSGALSKAVLRFVHTRYFPTRCGVASPTPRTKFLHLMGPKIVLRNLCASWASGSKVARMSWSVWSVQALRRVISHLQTLQDGQIMSEDVVDSCSFTLELVYREFVTMGMIGALDGNEREACRCVQNALQLLSHLKDSAISLETRTPPVARQQGRRGHPRFKIGNEQLQFLVEIISQCHRFLAFWVCLVAQWSEGWVNMEYQ